MQTEILTRNTITDAFHRASRRSPNKTMLKFENRCWSYYELEQAVNNVAIKLYSTGLVAGDRLAVYGRNSDIYLITFLACVQAGIIHVPINYALVEKDLKYIIEQSGASALFYDPALQTTVTSLLNSTTNKTHWNLNVTGLLYGDDSQSLLNVAQHDQEADRIINHNAQETDCVQIMYTSGTTSLPKGAMMTHRCLMTQYMSCIAHLNFKATDLWLAALPLYHTAQMHSSTIPALLLGATSILIEAPSPVESLQIIEKEKVTSLFAPPTVWISFLRHEIFSQVDLSSLRNIYYAASAMPESIIHELQQHLPKTNLFHLYGQTELSPLATVLMPNEHTQRPLSVGKPVICVETRVVDKQMQDVPCGTLGEIVHRSPHLMAGYWNKPKETEEAFSGGWFHTGDLGKMDEEGFLYVLDRIKDVINTGGVLVASSEVEGILYEHQAVEEVAVIATPDDKWIEVITAIIVLRKHSTVTTEDIFKHARENLAAFKIPKVIHFTNTLPKNASGKILKRALRDHYS